MLEQDLIQILLCYGVFLCAFLSNVVLNIYFNTEKIGEVFSKKKLFTGIKKMLTIIVGSLLLVIAIDGALVIFNTTISLPSELETIISIAMIISTIGVSTYKYIKEAYETLIKILDLKKEKELIED